MSFDLSGYLRRIRRTADLSQRQLAEGLGIPKSTLAAAEAGSRDLPAGRLAEAAALAGLRIALVDADAREIPPMTSDAARDAAHRQLPAHLDTLHSDEVPDRWEHRPRRRQPWFTFELDRSLRDTRRARHGVPDDHHAPRPGDSPAERRAARQRAARLRREEDLRRRLAAGEIAPSPEWTCTCPPRCDELDDRSGRPVHADECPCSCDLA
ncbi:helix-turn-helix domain-containing protein [Blastococcus tunisiensis]|uniref:Helix-turn-helix n=1 Tax=Blastococcus tunisiensis TaxID=1798228 RepID=A0A1I1XIL9_9ACTN|nr:helix-turn-helix transcriptional regulator [Blastococcus sp. DSM 46838]SFE07274.1 Helix-turn-helix [Blastococcus sp. DSM 46838]